MKRSARTATGRPTIATSATFYGDAELVRKREGHGYVLRLETLRPIGGGDAIVRWVAEISTRKIAIRTIECYVDVPHAGAEVPMDVLEHAALIGADEKRLMEKIYHLHKDEGVGEHV